MAAPPSAASSSELIAVVSRFLGELVRSDAFERGDVSAALQQLTEASAEAIGVERASIWRFGDGGRDIRCLDLFERTARRHVAGEVLRQEDAPAYFAALDADRTIAAHDAQADPRTTEFTAAYLAPNGIGAMLDAPIFIGKTHVGVVCHEHVGGPRTWTAYEQLVAATFADFAVMLFGAEERGRQARALDAYRTQLEDVVAQRTRQLRESEEAFRHTFEGAPVALTVARLLDHRLTAANDRAAELFGYPTPDAMLGSLAPGYWVDPAERTRLVAEAEANGTVDGFVGRLQTVDGKPFWGDVAVHLVTHGGERSLLFGIRDITVQKELEQRLRELATTDELTGLLNRRRLFEIGEEERERAVRYGRPLSLCMFDLDHFKKVNDVFGHQAGDATLRRVAATIGATVRKHDRLARYGGEELVAVFPETRREDARVVTERARAAVEALAPNAESPAPVTVSAGVVEWSAGESLEALLRRADEALYEAKSAGRNQVVVR